MGALFNFWYNKSIERGNYGTNNEKSFGSVFEALVATKASA
ncbi:hypothetical protein SLUDD06_00014 [Streptococcus lutetiensis]|nr:hypothetical protein SLUDD06_00014 [Streptococcus lutetiensis]